MKFKVHEPLPIYRDKSTNEVPAGAEIEIKNVDLSNGSCDIYYHGVFIIKSNLATILDSVALGIISQK